MPDTDGLLSALVLDGQGGARTIDWQGVRAWDQQDGPLWVHLDRKAESAQKWLHEESNLDTMICDALLAEETRPRTQIFGDGAIVILRGVNLNPGAEPDDMISVRMWLAPQRVVSLRFPRLMAIQDVRDDLASRRGARNTVQIPIAIITHLNERMKPVLANLDEILDDLEAQVVDQPAYDLRRQLGQIRRQAITLRRYIAPQRDAIAHLANAQIAWLADPDKSRLRELQDQTLRYVEDLDALRERAAVVQEELAGRLGEQMNRNMYVLSLVAGVFLPLGLLTGLLGINVGGVPGTENPFAFWIVCAILLALTVLGLWLFRRLRMY